MKRFTILLSVLTIAASSAMAFDLKEALKKAAGGKDNSTIDAITEALDGVLSTDKLDINSLTGSWQYSAPAVTFKSDNLLKKAGGSAASGMIEEKLAPIYRTAGFDKMNLTVDKDGNFSMKVRAITLKGTIQQLDEAGSQANFVFNFQAAKLKIGKMNAYVQKSATGKLKVMFDVSKLITLIETAGKITKNSTINSVVTMLKSYDGLCAGFELQKQ